MPIRVKLNKPTELPAFFGRIVVTKEKGCFIHSDEVGDIAISSSESTEPGTLFVNAEEFQRDDVVQINPLRNEVYILYRRGSNSNGLYVTDRCNSRCIMCPQPPKEEDTVPLQDLFLQIKYWPDDVDEICITGGEPTLLGTDLIRLLHTIAQKNSSCKCHILTNGRLCKDPNFVRQLCAPGLELTFGIPIYGSTADLHDFIVQAPGAFDESLQGIYHLAEAGFGIEIRIVLHKQTIPELHRIADFIYNKMPYVFHVAFMGLEQMGYVKKNWALLESYPQDYQRELYDAVRFLHLRGIPCSLYNLPICLTAPGLRGFLRKSISDYKVDYADECVNCTRKSDCAGLFHYQRKRMNVIPFRNNA